MKFPIYSLTLALGSTVYRVQFNPDRSPFMVRQARQAAARSRNPEDHRWDTVITWSPARGEPDDMTRLTIMRARDILAHHGWPRRLDLAL